MYDFKCTITPVHDYVKWTYRECKRCGKSYLPAMGYHFCASNYSPMTSLEQQLDALRREFEELQEEVRKLKMKA